MALKIRLRQQGRRNSLKYRLVLADSRSPRDGKYIETLGHYDPALESGQDINVLPERISYWIGKGAELTEKAESLIKRAAPEVVAEMRKKDAEKKALLVEKRRAAKKAAKKK